MLAKNFLQPIQFFRFYFFVFSVFFELVSSGDAGSTMAERFKNAV